MRATTRVRALPGALPHQLVKHVRPCCSRGMQPVLRGYPALGNGLSVACHGLQPCHARPAGRQVVRSRTWCSACSLITGTWPSGQAEDMNGPVHLKRLMRGIRWRCGGGWAGGGGGLSRDGSSEARFNSNLQAGSHARTGILPFRVAKCDTKRCTHQRSCRWRSWPPRTGRLAAACKHVPLACVTASGSCASSSCRGLLPPSAPSAPPPPASRLRLPVRCAPQPLRAACCAVPATLSSPRRCASGPLTSSRRRLSPNSSTMSAQASMSSLRFLEGQAEGSDRAWGAIGG